jgi:hypothetical protein
MASDKQKLANQLRKTAAHFRWQASEIEKTSAVKCAQILTAARGLAQFKRILRGAQK